MKDHECWVRPENMRTPRTVLKIDQNTPGTEIAAETSAALASSAMALRRVDHAYSHRLLNKAKLVRTVSNIHSVIYQQQRKHNTLFIL